MNLFARIKHLWALESFRPDVPLSRGEASRFLPWIIALMVYLTALTLSGSFTLHRTVMAGQTAQIASFSVTIPHSPEQNDDIAQKAFHFVRNTPGVEQAEFVSTDRIREMVEPWLGRGESLNNLPLPIIIEAKLEPGAVVEYAHLKARLQDIAPGAEIDDHRQWAAQFAGFVHMVQWVLFVIAVMIMTASAAAVIFACKTSLKIHRSTVHLLHRLGAYDNYIANQFQQHAALLALKGAFVGSGFAAGTLLLLHIASRQIDSPLFPSFALSLNHWVILLALPLVMSLIALASARISVLAALQRMP